MFCEASVLQLTESKATLRTEKDKCLSSQLLSGKVLKKYKVEKKANTVVSAHLR